MSSFKKLSKADVTTVPYRANKQWDLSYACFSDSYFNVYKGTYITGTFSSTDLIIDPVTNGQYERLVFDSINHLFYQKYMDMLDTGSLMFDVNTYESASQQRPTASYFDYNINPLLVKNFPTSSGDGILVLSINANIYGSKVLPHYFRMSSSLYDIIDDGNGNLFDISKYEDDYIDLDYVLQNYFDDSTPGIGIIPVGNIFYSHGISVITNPTYQSILPLLPIDTGSFNLSFKNEHIIYENEVRCIVKESEYNLSYNPTLVTGSYESGSLRNFATTSTFHPYATTIGLYNDDNELLMVAKLGKPIVLSSDTDMTFIIHWDS